MTEKTTIGKMTFYDIVTLVVPSALICCAYPKIPIIECSMAWLSYAAQFGVALMIGLVLKNFGAWWSKCWFRNNTNIIVDEEEKQIIGNDSFSFCAFMHTWFCDPILYCFAPLIRLFNLYHVNKEKLDEYYNQYDEAYNNLYYSKRLEILESHVAFLQTWICALFAIVFADLCSIWLLLLACYLSIVVMIAIQRKIYQMVWESRQYGKTKTK